ncbi:hypothetical protein AVENLUH5627_00878 [Acinetobacter venetianus]|uniref:Uncharacterized protein n=1 Tax=Acinetobacter venetianus TaxID=52133 RepID=A0A150I0I3_9GAMM|nr:hypothetical protein [Acinetobacter venetianus]KXZ73109.1 hypothetical protein AVENLUH5627_00878 [Acinetobacter venetianus]
MKMLPIYIFSTLSLFSNCTFAENDYDVAFIEAGALDRSYKIVNQEKYNELINFMNDLARKSRSKLSNEEMTFENIRLDANGLVYTIYIKDYQLLSSLEKSLYKVELKESMKQKMCNRAALTQSHFFRLYTLGNVVYEIVNDQFQNIDTIKINYKACDTVG